MKTKVLFGCIWEVEEYEVSKEFMEEFDLTNKEREKLTCIMGNEVYKTGDTLDFARA